MAYLKIAKRRPYDRSLIMLGKKGLNPSHRICKKCTDPWVKSYYRDALLGPANFRRNKDKNNRDIAESALRAGS